MSEAERNWIIKLSAKLSLPFSSNTYTGDHFIRRIAAAFTLEHTSRDDFNWNCINAILHKCLSNACMLACSLNKAWKHESVNLIEIQTPGGQLNVAILEVNIQIRTSGISNECVYTASATQLYTRSILCFCNHKN